MMSRQIRQIGLKVAIAACLVYPTVAFGQGESLLQQRQAELQAVEDYLKSLQLDELVIEHLELETSREIDFASRRQMATRLIGEYARRMMSGRNGVDSDCRSKAELLLQTYPELSTPSIRVAILQAKYLTSEDAFRKWWDSGRDENLRGELVSRWFELNSELVSLNRQLNNDYEDQVALLQASVENNRHSRQLSRLDGLLLHTDYLIGWSSYFLGVLIPENRRPLMQTADSHFRSFLQIEPQRTLTEVPPEWFDFSSDWNSRSLVGLALCQRGLDHPLQSQYCFELIETHATVQQTRELRFVWDLNSRVYLDEYSAALEFVDSMGEARQLSESGRTAFWMATLNASNATRDRAPVISRRLLRSGLTGLARQFDAARIESFLKAHRIQITGEDFFSLWLAGYLDFRDAETTNASGAYDAAMTKLAAALTVADQKTNPLDIARCQFLIAKIRLHQRDYESASRAFLECSKSFDGIAPELSAESLWLAVRSLSEQSHTQTRSLLKANRAIDQLMRRFPGSTFAKRAEFERLRLNVASLTADEAIDRLNRVESNDLNYALAANEIVKIRYQTWLDAHQTKSESELETFKALLEAESEYEQLETVSEESKLKTQLMVVDAMLRTESIDVETARQRLDRAKAAAEAIGSHLSLYQEYRYYRFLLANRAANQDEAFTEAQWLAEHAPGTPFEKSAFILLAQLFDQRLQSQINPSPEEVATVKTIFSKLVGLLGSSASELKQSANARVAYARLAALEFEGGSTDKAIEMLVSLNAQFPNHKSYLRQLASIYTQSQHYDDAVSIWQKLIRGVEPGSDLWLESKYNLAYCLYSLGQKGEARKLHEQTRHLSPELPKKWVKQFDDLSALLAREKDPPPH